MFTEALVFLTPLYLQANGVPIACLFCIQHFARKHSGIVGKRSVKTEVCKWAERLPIGKLFLDSIEGIDMKKIATLVLTLVLGFGFVGGFTGCEEAKKDTSKPATTGTKKEETKEEKKEETKDETKEEKKEEESK